MKNDQKNKLIGSMKPLLLVLFMFSASLAFAQTKTVTGTVVDQKGDPIIGATIQVKGTTTGTITDFNGAFKINAAENATLQFSSIGYTNQTATVAGKSTFRIVLSESTQALDEVVVVGYGTVKKSDVTGAVSSINSDQLKERSNTNAMQSLAGQVAGVQIQQTQGAPGTAPTIKIRGTSTITAGTSPLYVIDGYPMEGVDMGNINPQDIESIEVLKDASSTAIYGSRGSNGVVLVTTKSGKAGKTKVDITYEKGFQQLVRKVDMMDSQEFIQYYIDAHNNAWIAKGGKASDSNDVRPQSYQIPSEFISDPQKFATTDWQDVLFRTAPNDNVQLSISGGTDKTKFLISGAFINQNGIVDNSKYKRSSVRTNITHQISPSLKVGANIALIKIDSKEYGTEGKTGAVSLALQNDPIFPVYNENGNLGFRDPKSEWYRFVPYGLQLWHPYSLTREIDKLNQKYNVTFASYAEYNFLKDFTFKTSLDASFNNSHYTEYQNAGQKYGYSAWNPAQGIDNSYYTFNWLTENILSYNKIFNEHSINALVGYSTQKNSYQESLITSNSFPNDMVHTLNAGKPVSASSNASNWSMISYIGRVNYSYQNEYLLTTTIRRDGCSRFGNNTKWGYFPSASFAWKASEEEFFKNISWITSLKLRASYGMTGNNLIPNYGAIGQLQQTQYAWGSTVDQGLYPSNISNSDLKWEKTGQFDLGLNLGMLSNRIYVEADYYNSTTKDVLLNIPVPVLTGYTEQLTNIGKVRNTGFEFLITSKNLVGAFKWDTKFNISFNKNKVLKLGPNNAPIYINNWGTTKTEVGQPVANYYGYVFDGVFMNQSEIDNYPHVSSTTPGDPKVKDVNGDQVIDEKDRTIIGNAQPDYTLGLINTFTYKHFDLNIVLQASMGNEILNSQTRYSKYYNGNRNGYKSIVNYWKSEDEPGDGKTFKPNISYPGLQTQFSSFWVEDGSYLRISNVRLGYNFSSVFMKKLPIESARLYVNVDNLYVFTKYLGYDPENSVFTDALNTGNDYGAYPVPRTITFGLKLSF
ncbi:MAG: TonB-dependent receptor [Bacteroidales bacterium]|nr:TonB-dependent receptor [Bacteroidales bacterium]